MILWENKEALRKEIERIQTSPYADFYRKKFSFPSTPDSLTITDLPFLSRTELVDTPPAARLYVPQEDVAFIGFTSGTTSGKPLVSYFSSVARYFFEPSLGTSITRALITYPPLNKNFSASFIQQCRQAERKVTPVFADYQNLPNSAVLARETRADAIYATPTIAGNLGEYIAKYYTPEKIRLLALSSETLSQTKRALLTRQYPNATIANLYASSEIGQFILYPCAHMLEQQEPSFHFLCDALIALELIDGELVVTYALNKAFPLIRYRTGDFFEVARESCACGLPGATLRWSGREQVDKVRIHGFEIRAEDLENFFASLHGLAGDDYQIHINHDTFDAKKIRIDVELKNKTGVESHHRNIADMVKNEMLRHWMLAPGVTLAHAIEKGVISDIQISFVQEFSLITTKTRRLVNHCTEYV
ncbi:MAG: hypothetical protein NT108_02680 [Candidatus Kaiserbacteria bacterium]|nr:hypothetical protein [Candidatus Kaiserbacteria bacterium]